jgi:hypothetical protein
MTHDAGCDCRRRHGTATIQTAHIVHARTPGRTLQFAVTGAGHEPRITVTAEDENGVAVGGFIGLRDVRRMARALTTGVARTYLGLRPWNDLPGGRLCVEQDGDDVYLVASPVFGRPTLFGPLPAATLSAVCRDVVGWNRLLVRSGAAAEGAE